MCLQIAEFLIKLYILINLLLQECLSLRQVLLELVYDFVQFLLPSQMVLLNFLHLLLQLPVEAFLSGQFLLNLGGNVHVQGGVGHIQDVVYLEYLFAGRLFELVPSVREVLGNVYGRVQQTAIPEIES